MGTIIIILIGVMLISITLFFSLREKKICPVCNSNNIIKTGKKVYKEETQFTFSGSPSSYHQLEHKCNDCGHIFLIKQKAVIFN